MEPQRLSGMGDSIQLFVQEDENFFYSRIVSSVIKEFL